MIIPVVFYHGAEKWSPLNLRELAGSKSEELLAYVPSFDFVVSDFSAASEPDIRGANLLQAVLRLLHSVPGGDLKKELDTIMFLLRGEILDAAGEQIFRVILHYIFNTVENVTVDEVIQVAGRQLTAAKEREAMTIAEQLRNEGMQQGMQQELREDIEAFLGERFGECPYLISEKLGMIYDREKLRALLRFSVRCESLVDFERGL